MANDLVISWAADSSANDIKSLLLFVGLILLSFFLQSILAQWFPNEPAPEIETLLQDLSEQPWLMALWLGPVLWTGVARFEALSRVFFLNRYGLCGPKGLDVGLGYQVQQSFLAWTIFIEGKISNNSQITQNSGIMLRYPSLNNIVMQDPELTAKTRARRDQGVLLLGKFKIL